MDKSPDVLIIWSKEESKKVALALREWLPDVLDGIIPWMSEEDIAKGIKWNEELHKKLAQTKAGIICVTKENVRSPWIYYEAGAIAVKGEGVKNGIKSFVYPYLVGVSKNMLADGPLVGYQNTTADRKETWLLIKSINDNLLDLPYNESRLKKKFEEHWPNFEAQIKPIAELEVDDEEGFITTDADQLAGVNLSAEARKMILEVSEDPKGQLMYISYKSREGIIGRSFQTKGVDLCPDKSHRTIARWEAAKESLVSYGILNPLGEAGTVFELTDIGYDIADALRGDKVT